MSAPSWVAAAQSAEQARRDAVADRFAKLARQYERGLLTVGEYAASVNRIAASVGVTL